jgi:UDP-glucose 4-epimerase
MRVLLTGALGTNGRWVALQLLDDGHDVVGFDSSTDTRSLGALANEISVVTGDVTDLLALQSVLRRERIDTIVHAAGILAGPSNADAQRAIDINCSGTLSVLEAARHSSVERVVFCSSIAAYAPFTGVNGYPEYRAVDEQYPSEPGAPFRVYGATKRLCESLGIHYHEADGLQFVALRFSMILVPGVSAERHFAGVPPQAALSEAAVAGRPFRLEGGADERADFMYVKDLAQSLGRAVTAPGDPTGIYNIGSGELCSLQDMATAVRQIIPDADIAIGPGRDPLGINQYYCLFDISRAREKLDYEPKYTEIGAAVADYIAEMRAGNTLEHA